jgi:hypothetical protein
MTDWGHRHSARVAGWARRSSPWKGYVSKARSAWVKADRNGVKRFADGCNGRASPGAGVTGRRHSVGGRRSARSFGITRSISASPGRSNAETILLAAIERFPAVAWPRVEYAAHATGLDVSGGALGSSPRSGRTGATDISAEPRHWPCSDGRTKRRNSGPSIGTISRVRRRIRARLCPSADEASAVLPFRCGPVQSEVRYQTLSRSP